MRYLILAVLALYGLVASVPASWTHFEIGYVDVNYPNVAFNSRVKRDFLGSYSVTIRNTEGSVVCESHSGVFTYRSRVAIGARRVESLEWWAPGCGDLEPGTYTMDTTWTIHRGWRILPNQHVTITSNEFKVN